MEALERECNVIDGFDRRKSNQYSQSNVCNETTKIEKETLRLNLFATR
jgi:hypothetical protein